jgi:GGDEF domain-containing protein
VNVRSPKPHPTDPVTGFGSRDQLIADLDQALGAESSAGVLAVFDLAGSEEQRRRFGAEASDLLVARLAEACAQVVSVNGRCYRPRQDEFCVLVDLPLEDAMTVIEDTVRTLREEGEPSLGSVSFGVAVLPDEADDPIDALIIADQHLDTRRRRERRHHHEHPGNPRG